MSDKIVAAILSKVQGDWSILDELARKSEPQRRRILRAHDEAGFDASRDRHPTDMDLRKRLDEALDRLLLLELGAGTVHLSDVRITHAFAENASIGELSKSDSFLRFLDAYLYFGVRILLGRLAAERAEKEKDPAAKADAECNYFPAALRCPPAPEPIAFPLHRREAAIEKFIALNDSVDAEIQTALDFLDGFQAPGMEDEPVENESANYELWLRGLWHESPKSPGAEDRFRQLTSGITKWVGGRIALYKLLEDDSAGADPAWVARNPLSARFALADIYWIARLLRADISSAGRVTCSQKTWIELIAAHENVNARNNNADGAPVRILRGVFDFACDLIQNSIELTEKDERCRLDPEQSVPFESASAVSWRAVLDEELAEIHEQKYLRTFQGSETPLSHSSPAGCQGDPGWSRRIRTGEYPAQEIIGLAFSGGGIRSATFGLGVLQGLQDLDLLKSVDYLSTVSGGGYIGAWLLGNVLRTPHWLGRQTNWEDSISHLRRYSKYLAPHTGLLSADSWTMGGSWLRNAFLVQLTAFAWLVCILASCLFGKPVFDAVNNNRLWLGLTGETIAHGLAFLSVLWLAFGAIWNLLFQASFTEWQVQYRLVIPAWVCAFLTSAMLWAQATGKSVESAEFSRITEYSQIIGMAFRPWVSLVAAMFIGFAVLGWRTMEKEKALGPVWGALATVVLYLETCGVMWLFRQWATDPGKYGWYAFAFGPSLVLISASLAVVLFIGLCGRWSHDQTREWWTRMGSWLAMYGVAYLIVTAAAVLGPLWVLALFQLNWWGLKWGAIAGYAGTVIGGLLAGKSSRTSGASNTGLEYLARSGAVLFIVGALLGVATVLHIFMLEAFTPLPISSQPLSYSYWYNMNAVSGLPPFVVAGATLLIGALLSWRVELNTFGLNYFYRNRLVRCYLGATRWRPGMRRPNRFTGFDENDDIPLASLKTNRKDKATVCGLRFRGPFPLVNCTLNLGGSSDLGVETRKSASFQITPLRCGSDRLLVGYAPTDEFAGGPKLGQAMSVSGAAASPNMGYNSSTLVSFLLTMFNVRLGWWFPNPSRKGWEREKLPPQGFSYLIRELFGYAGEAHGYLNVSDGGHFENLGIYELVRRRVKVIVAADGECDERLQFGSLGNLVRICETDFGAKIDIDVSSIRKQESGFSLAHCAVGRIDYSNGSKGWLIYLKASISGDEDVGVAQYRAVHPDFPHESTADQFFTEDQFESYRRLGRHVVQHTFRGTDPAARFTEVAHRLSDTWTPAGFSSAAFLTHTKSLDDVWERFRASGGLHRLLDELTADRPQPPGSVANAEELCACLELVQLMENVFIDLRLDAFWTHPDNRGWAMLFSSWAKSPTFREAWTRIRRTYGIRFQYFCEERLGFETERPVARV
jgi:hypothetical protein